MKKILILLVLALMLTGCARLEDIEGYKNFKGTVKSYSNQIKEKFKKDVDAHLSDGTNVIWTHGDYAYTENDLFEVLKGQAYEDVITNELLKKFAEKKNVSFDDIEKDAENSVQELLDQGYQEYIEYYYGSVDAYKELLKQSQLEYEYKKIAATKDYETYKNDILPYQAQIAYFDSEDVAKEVIETVNNEEHTFEYIVQEKGFTGNAQIDVYADDSDLPVEVKDAILNSNKTGMLDVVSSSTYATDSSGNSTINPRYYVINLVSKNADDFKDEFIDYLVSNKIDVYEVINEDIELNNLVTHDQTTYNKLSKRFDKVK